MKTFSAALIGSLLLAASAPLAASADERWHGDIHHFHDRDLDHWRGGHWFHGRHTGRDGWWWVVGPYWYFYPAPVYPFPDPYRPPVVAAPVAPAPTQYWYYCRNPAGYYPYVARCRIPWEAVVPQPAPPPG